MQLFRRAPLFSGWFAAFSVASLFVLAGCSAKYEWREISPEKAPMVFSLPAKPSSMTRPINLDGLSVEMQMHGARAGGQTFTAAWVRLPVAGDEAEPDARKAVAAKAIAAMEKGMLNNISGSIDTREDKSLVLALPGASQGGLVPTQFIDSTGTAQGEPVRMQAMFAAVGENLFQFVVMGAEWSDEAAATFFNGLRLQIALPAASS